MTKHKSAEDDIPPELNPEDIQPQPEPVPPEPFYNGSEFQPEWRSALDDPKHPLHHLRNA